MREGHFVIQEAYANGLRPDKRLPNDAPYLKLMKNARPKPWGACRYETVNQAIAGQAASWPFPQLFYGEQETLLFDETAVYAVNTTGDWSITQLATYDADSILTPKAIPEGGGPWHVIDMGPVWVAFNGVCAVFKTAAVDSVLVQDSVTVQTGCALGRDRAVMAGFDESNFWRSTWQTFFDERLSNLPDELGDKMDFTAGASGNWVWWSSIGADDLLWLWDPTLLIYGPTPSDGLHGPDNPYIFDLLRMNQAGMAPMPWKGSVLRVLPLGNGVAVYGEQGATWLEPVVTSAPTMAVRPIPGLAKGIGPCQRSSVYGDEFRHVLVDSEGVLWLIRMGEFGPQGERLGYEEYLKPLVDEELPNVVASYDDARQEFWISGRNACYVLTAQGLGGPIDVKPTSLCRVSGALTGVYGAVHDVCMMQLETHPISLQEGGSKHVTSFQAGMTDMGVVRGAVSYRDRDGDWRDGFYKPFNRAGVCFPTTSFGDGRMKVLGKALTEDACIHRLEVRYNAEDRSYRRGTKGIPEVS